MATVLEMAKAARRPGRARALVKAAIALVALASGAAVVAESSGFIPPASFVLRRMAAKMSSLRGVQATLAGRTFASDDDGGSEASAKLYLASPDRFRIDVKSDKGEWSEVWSQGARALKGSAPQGAGAGGTGPAGGETKGAHPLAGLFLGNARTFLGERGVALEQVNLARLGAHLCWILGAAQGDEKRPQLWIDKDSFLPVRFVTHEGDTLLDWRFDGYDRSDTSTAFPKTIELRKNGVRVLHLSVVAIDAHGVPSESLFAK